MASVREGKEVQWITLQWGLLLLYKMIWYSTNVCTHATARRGRNASAHCAVALLSHSHSHSPSLTLTIIHSLTLQVQPWAVIVIVSHASYYAAVITRVCMCNVCTSSSSCAVCSSECCFVCLCLCTCKYVLSCCSLSVLNYNYNMLAGVAEEVEGTEHCPAHAPSPTGQGDGGAVDPYCHHHHCHCHHHQLMMSEMLILESDGRFSLLLERVLFL